MAKICLKQFVQSSPNESYKMSYQGVSNVLAFCKSVFDFTRLLVWSELGVENFDARKEDENKLSGGKDTK